MNGRGRGINNAPAWMSRENPDGGQQRDQRGPGGGPPDPYGRGEYPPRRDSYDHRPPPPPSFHHPRGGGPPPHHRGGGGGRRPHTHNKPRTPGGSSHNLKVPFTSRQHEREWVEERRRKRQHRVAKFDVLPDATAAAAAGVMGNSSGGMIMGGATTASAALNPQQTRHARRLYVGNLPLGVTEEEIHQHFGQAIRTATIPTNATDHNTDTDDDDPILSVYINHERRFCFLEFKRAAWATAGMQLDGLVLRGQALKIKRPNDYNEAAALQQMNHSQQQGNIPQLDVSRLGIISSNVLDGPNKVFIGGLHYHLTEAQVLELLQAFGKIKAFHLVKSSDGDVMGGGGPGPGGPQLSKGYCFVEYADPSVTATAIQGLHGMEIGGGKSLTARLAGERNSNLPATAGMDPSQLQQQQQQQQAAAPPTIPGAPPPDRTIVAGYDIESLVDAAMGRGVMPTTPVYTDAMGLPLTRIVPTALLTTATSPLLQQPPNMMVSPPPLANSHSNNTDSLVAAVAAAAALPPLPPTAAVPPPPPPNNTHPPSNSSSSSRILVLHNMVQDDDLATDEDYQALVSEVRDECAKYGTLRSVEIPRRPPRPPVQPSAVGKIYLEYATLEEAERARQELSGRQFGDAVVQVTPYSEVEYGMGKLV